VTETIHLEMPGGGVSRRTNIALAVVSGILMGCAFPPIPAPVLAFIGLVPLLIMLSRIDGVMRPLRYSYIAWFIFNSMTL
jgi:apolipoprotein N-acyltransferase